MAHETNSYAKYDAKLFELLDYRKIIVEKKTNYCFYVRSEPFSCKNISNLCWNCFPMNIVKNN